MEEGMEAAEMAAETAVATAAETAPVAAANAYVGRECGVRGCGVHGCGVRGCEGRGCEDRGCEDRANGGARSHRSRFHCEICIERRHGQMHEKTRRVRWESVQIG